MIEINNVTEVLNHLDGLKAVIFDLDDTLYSEKDYVKSGYQRISQFFPEIEWTELWDAFEDGKPAIDYVLEKHEMLAHKDECLRIYRNQIPDILVYDGVYEMLEKIKSKGLKLGMITDGRPEGQHNKIEALHLKEYFDKIIITDELGGIKYRKPNPMAYQVMHDEFGIDYSEMCYVGDNLKKDFVSPKKLGMSAIIVKNAGGLYINN